MSGSIVFTCDKEGCGVRRTFDVARTQHTTLGTSHGLRIALAAQPELHGWSWSADDGYRCPRHSPTPGLRPS